ncbi:MAG: hypothetical protein ABIJ65_02830 [Chloroflexota bacterium]
MSGLDDEMRQIADKGVTLAKSKYHQALDFSKDSLNKLEIILLQDIDNNKYLDSLGKKHLAEKKYLAYIWGSYLGEVIHCECGGSWVTDEVSGRYLLINGVKVNPFIFIQNRLSGKEQVSASQYLDKIGPKSFFPARPANTYPEAGQLPKISEAKSPQSKVTLEPSLGNNGNLVQSPTTNIPFQQTGMKSYTQNQSSLRQNSTIILVAVLFVAFVAIRYLNLPYIYFLTLFFLGTTGFLIFLYPEGLRKLPKLILRDGLNPSGKPVFTLILTTLLGILMVIGSIIRYSIPWGSNLVILEWYKEDGVLETLTPILLTMSIFLLAYALISLYGKKQERQSNKIPMIVFGLLMIGCFLFSGEEISWGQNYFRWKTPETIFAGNVQHETNLHNFFNNYLVDTYKIGTLIVLILVILPIILDFMGKNTFIFQLVLPHASLIILALIMAFAYHTNELVEQLGAVFILFYSLRVARVMQVHKRRI